MRVLSLQPYFGESHRSFQRGWQQRSRHDWKVLTLEPRHWKWRMHHSAIHFNEVISNELSNEKFDVVFCTDFLNVAEFKGLASPCMRDIPVVVYFHENQFAYPVRRKRQRDLNYAFTNFTTCLAANEVWFNSRFNYESFMDGLTSACRKWPDHVPWHAVESLKGKVQIQSPGISWTEPVVNRKSGEGKIAPILLWAARWEHDKNPGLLLEGLEALEKTGTDYRISVAGESFRRVPPEFDRIKERFAHRIHRWGYQEGDEYQKAMQESSFYVSTAGHEFFGIAAAEAIANGCVPVLPNRLAYPELLNVDEFPERGKWFLYDGTAKSMAGRLQELIDGLHADLIEKDRKDLQLEMCQRLDWSIRASEMDQQIEEICCT